MPGSLPDDFETTDNPGGNNGGFSTGPSGGTGFPSDFDFDDNNGVDNNIPSGGIFGGNGGGGAGGGGGGGNIPANPDDNDVNCDYLGTCYDGNFSLVDILQYNMSIPIVSVHCKDTRIVVNVGTNKPFSGRIYALGRSETCNVDVINSDTFRLDLTMAGQDCNTQSAVQSSIINSIYIADYINCREACTPILWWFRGTAWS